MKKLSYVLLGDSVAWDKNKTKKERLHSGLWQWSRAFDEFGERGEIRLIFQKEELEKYDVCHINLTGGDMALPQRIRDELGNSSSTKLIVNMDFDPMLWGQTWAYPTLMEKSLRAADMVFQVDSRGAKYIERIINKPAYALPHPVDVNGLDKYKKEDREPTIVTIWHRYIQDCITPYYAQRGLPAFKILLGYTGQTHNIGMFDWVHKYLPFLEGIEIMSKAAFGYDMYMGYNYGRAVIEFAALAVPCVCSSTSEAGTRLFPTLAVHPLDINRQHDLFMELIENEDKKEDAYKYAYDAAKYYTIKNSYARMVDALEDVEDRQRQQTGGGTEQKADAHTLLGKIPSSNQNITRIIPDNEIVKMDDQKSWQMIQDRYEKRTGHQKPESYLKFARDLAGQFKKFVGIRGWVLDIGCGNGKYASGTYESMEHEYLDKGNNIIGLDPLESFETRFPVVRGFGEDIPFQDGVFDAVVIATTLDHVIDPLKVLNESKRVMTNNGRIFIQNYVTETETNPWHLHVWSGSTLLSLLEKAFKVIKTIKVGDETNGYSRFIEGAKK